MFVCSLFLTTGRSRTGVFLGSVKDVIVFTIKVCQQNDRPNVVLKLDAVEKLEDSKAKLHLVL